MNPDNMYAMLEELLERDLRHHTPVALALNAAQKYLREKMLDVSHVYMTRNEQGCKQRMAVVRDVSSEVWESLVLPEFEHIAKLYVVKLVYGSFRRARRFTFEPED